MIKKHISVFGLLDCNNFFVSCERLFVPRLAKLPVLVLSNNDGCVISRSNEVKALNIKMGAPFFKLKPIIKKHNIQVFSSNHVLYREISERIMRLLRLLVPALEVYSIDEAFLDFSGFSNGETSNFGRKIVKRITEGIGIPVSLGIGPTKTLAKIANHIAKKEDEYGGTFNILEVTQSQILSAIAVEDVWGIGPRWATQLRILGIKNAYQLSQQDPVVFQKKFNKILASIILELNGVSTFPLETKKKPKKQIMVSRSFGRTVTELREIKEALASHTTQALETLRKQGSVAQTIFVFLQTNRFSHPTNSYHHEICLNLPIATDDTKAFLKAALQGAAHLYSSNTSYKKAGVVINKISQKNALQMDLFYPTSKKSEKMIQVLDKINTKMGQGTLKYAVDGFKKPWHMRSAFRSPCYTTCWADIPVVKS